jgi:hypothetical protein
VYLGESLSLFSRLADVFHRARERIDGTRRLLTYGNDYQPGTTWEDSVRILEETRRLQFALNWDIASISVPLRFEIFRPDNTPIQPTDPGVAFVSNRTDAIYTIFQPESGRWRVRLSHAAHLPNIEALLTISASCPFYTRAILGPQRMVHDLPSSTLWAFAMDRSGFIRQADFIISVVGPDKKVEEIHLEDDGQSGDGRAGDGIFGTQISWPVPGSYLLNVAGTMTVGNRTFETTESIGFFNRAGTDRDRDGIPDSWEYQYAMNCTNGLNPRIDLDGDKLDNITEWRFETNPLSYDTDEDGYSDGEEYENGTDPTRITDPNDTRI